MAFRLSDKRLPKEDIPTVTSFLAPEVFQGKYSWKADVFSMGTIWHGILERQNEEHERKRLFGAFVYIPGLPETSDRLPLGFAMYHLIHAFVPTWDFR